MISTFVISMKNSVERRKLCYSYLKKAGIIPIPFEGINGNNIINDSSKNNLFVLQDKVVLKLPFGRQIIVNDKLSAAEIGCALSHLKVYEIILKSNIQQALILEDDALLNKNCLCLLSEILKFKDKFDIVQLVHDSGLRSFLPSKKIYIKENIYLKKEGMGIFNPIFNRRRGSFIAAAYIINRIACKKLLKLGYPVRMPADYLLGIISYNGLRLYTTHPMNNFCILSGLCSTISTKNSARPKHKIF